MIYRKRGDSAMAVKEEKGPIDAMNDAIHKGDKEFDKEVPGSLFAVVGLMYPFILVIVLFAIAIFFLLR
jgi:hypothetical protein